MRSPTCVVAILALLAFGSLCAAQTVSPPRGPLVEGQSVVFEITPSNADVGVESALASQSVTAHRSKIDVGQAKPGVFPLCFKSSSGVLEQGFLVLVPAEDGSNKLTVRWETTPASSSTESLRSAFRKYAANLSPEVLGNLTGPAIKKFAAESPVQVTSMFVVCVTPGMTSVCVVTFAESGKDCAVEMLKLAADDMVNNRKLTPKEAELVKSAIDGANLLVSVVLTGKDFLIDMKNPENRRKAAAACEAMAGVAGAAAGTIKDTSMRVVVKSFTDQIERICLLIKKVAP